MYATLKQQKGHIDTLFANAGIGEFAPLGAITEEHFDKTFNTNVKGLLFTVREALPLLKDGSSIILNASIVSSTGSPGLSIYSASKAAVRSFARTFTTDLKDRKIRVNAISPGVIPLSRTGALDEVAKVVSFLASDESSYVTGIELFVDGGLTQNLTRLNGGVSMRSRRRSRGSNFVDWTPSCVRRLPVRLISRGLCFAMAKDGARHEATQRRLSYASGLLKEQ